MRKSKKATDEENVSDEVEEFILGEKNVLDEDSDNDGTEKGKKVAKNVKEEMNESPKTTPKKRCTRSLALSGLSVTEHEIVFSLLATLGVFKIEEDVSKCPLLVVASENGTTEKYKRTIKLLQAISMGALIVKFEWILKCIEAGKYIPEEDFELAQEFPGTKISRENHADKGKKLLVGKSFYISGETEPSPSVVSQLITLNGGKVSSRPNACDYCISASDKDIPEKQFLGGHPVSVKFLLDAISNYNIPNFNDYLPGAAVKKDTTEIKGSKSKTSKSS